MHLALVINSLGVGGAERVLVRLAHVWALQGHRISFIIFFEEQYNCYKLPKHNNINLINLGEPKKNSNLILQVYKIIKRIYLLYKLFKKLQPEIIISFLVGANITVLLASIGVKIPVVVSERFDPASYVTVEAYKFFRFITYKLANKIVVQTKKVQEYFINSLQSKITVIPNWVNIPAFSKHIKLSCNYKIKNILSVGRLDQQKNHQLLIKAFARLSIDYPELKLIIHGEGVLRSELQQLIQDLSLQDKISLPGVTMNVNEALVKADLFVFPSLSEGFPNVLGEAMAVGLPVVASDCAGNKAILKHGINGVLFYNNSLNDLTDSIKKLIDNPIYANKLAINAKMVINKFNETDILKLWNQIIHQLNPNNSLQKQNNYVKI